MDIKTLKKLAKVAEGKSLLIVDTNNLIHRNAHAFHGLTAPDGRPSGALYGAISEMRKWCARFPVGGILMCVDAGKPKFRVQLVEKWAEEGDGYKAHRKERRDKKQEEIYEAAIAQLDYCDEAFTPFGIHVLRAKGFEADDLIGSIARNVPSPVIVCSGDKDMLQLIDERISVLNPATGELAKKPAGNYALCRAVSGDASDNIPGVPGVAEGWHNRIATAAGLVEVTGPKRFCRLLKEWVKTQDKPPKKALDILENRDRLIDYYRAMDLRRTIQCYESAEVIMGTWDSAKADKMCKRFAFRQFREAWDRMNNWMKRVHG
jgi:5'-3' exonuclease